MDKGNSKKPPARKPIGADDETVRLTPEEVAKFRHEDSEQIERAVYDGMQDLRVLRVNGNDPHFYLVWQTAGEVLPGAGTNLLAK